jgi:hypothetical protein
MTELGHVVYFLRDPEDSPAFTRGRLWLCRLSGDLCRVLLYGN